MAELAQIENVPPDLEEELVENSSANVLQTAVVVAEEEEEEESSSKDEVIKRQLIEIEQLRTRNLRLDQENQDLKRHVNKLKFDLEMNGVKSQRQQQHHHHHHHHSESDSTPQRSVDRSAAIGPSPPLKQLKSYSVDSPDSSTCSQQHIGSPLLSQGLYQRTRNRSIGSGGSCRRVPCRTAEDIIKCSRTPTLYELSQDLLDKQVEVLERKYGGQTRASHAALTIQRAFRKYCMVKKFHDITSAKSEKRLSRRFNGADLATNGNSVASRMAPAQDNSKQTQAELQQNFAALYRELSETLEPNDNGRPPRPVRSLSLREKRPSTQFSQPSPSSDARNASSRRTIGGEEITNYSESQCLDTGCGPEGNSSVLPSSQMRRCNTRQTHAQVHMNTVADHGDDCNFYSTTVCNDPRCEGNNSLGRRLLSGVGCGSRTVTSLESSSSSSSSSRRNSAPPPGDLLQKKVPPEVPKRTSSIITTQSSDGTKITSNSNGDVLLRSPDGGSLSSVQSSGSESSLTGSSTSDRVSSSSTRPDDSFCRTADSLSSSSLLPLCQPSPLEDKRLSNISENSEDSFEGTGYSSSPPVSEAAFRHPHILHTSCDTPLSTPPGYYKVSELVRKRQYRVGLNLFNKKPEKGVYYLIQRAFLENSAQAVARFLISRKGLSKQMIGEYLGNLQNPFNMDVLECFAGEIDLSGMQVDVALRRFQTCFRMPGEAQKIERLVEVFSSRYCECNRDIVSRFHNADTVFILAFAIIMLNTDLHTPNMKPEKRMKTDDFVRNLRGIDDGNNVDTEMLLGIYERIKVNEFRPGSDHVTQVMKVHLTIVGKKPTLALPHRRLVCYCRLYEVNDVNKKERQGVHQREVFLFNDLLVVTKILSKKKNGVTYTFRQSFPLCGLQVSLFQVPHYPHGIRLAQKVDDKVAIVFNARNEHDRTKFVEDLKESILEMDEMENLRIECELEKQQKLARSRATENRDSGVADMEMTPVVVINGVDSNKVNLPNGNATNGGGLKRSALSNSLLDIHEQMEKPQRRGSAGSLDSGMSVSFQSSAASLGSRDSSPHQVIASNGKPIQCCSSAGGNGSNSGKFPSTPLASSSAANQPSFLGGLFGKKGRNQTKSNIKALGTSTDSTEV